MNKQKNSAEPMTNQHHTILKQWWINEWELLKGKLDVTQEDDIIESRSAIALDSATDWG